MSNHYDLFSNENDIVLTKLVQTYLSYYKIKKEFLEARDTFFEKLYEEFPEYKKKIEDEKKSIIEKNEKGVEQVQENEEPIKDEEIKNEEIKDSEKKGSTLFHKIALQTHPDKKQDMNPIYFQQAQKAHEKGKIGKLYFISSYLHIPLHNLSEEDIKDIQESIDKKLKKIDHYKKTYPYVYKQTENEEVRKKLLGAFRNLDQPKK
jgi:hypothetical protein